MNGRARRRFTGNKPRWFFTHSSRPLVPCRPLMQALEQRLLLSSSVSGYVWQDANGDGIRQAGEEKRQPVFTFEQQNDTGQQKSGSDGIERRRRPIFQEVSSDKRKPEASHHPVGRRRAD